MSIKLLNMGGKHRKSRYDSSSPSDSDTSDSSSLESSDSEVPFVLNHSHRHRSYHRIKKSKHKKNKRHKKDRRYRSSSSDSSESCECKHKKHKHYGSKHHKKQKHHTNSNPTEWRIRRDIVIEILMTGITKIELHTTQKGINLITDITIEIKVVMIGHQKQIPMTGILTL